MAVIKFILIVLEVLCSVLLVGVILIQRSKDEGLGMAFGAGMGESLFGSRTGNVLTKITITLGSAFLVITMLLALTYSKGSSQTIIGGIPIGSARARSAAPMANPMGPAATPMENTAPVQAPAATEAPISGATPVAAPVEPPAAAK